MLPAGKSLVAREWLVVSEGLELRASHSVQANPGLCDLPAIAIRPSLD